MKVSVVATVLNEEGNIARLLDSLINQTRTPDEIVIVDGFSTDSTPEIIERYKRNNKYIKYYQKKGNISLGRNHAIEKAKHNIIAQIDAGCVAHKNWLERIVDPFEEDKSIGLVAGFYEMTGSSPLQKAVAPFHGITSRKFDHRSFLPSGRSVAFRKSTWKKVGGYSENLQWAGEDTLFNYRVLKEGIKIERVPSAYVYWEVPHTIRMTFNKFYKYALGDAQTKIWWHPGKNLATHNIKILFIYFRYFLGLLLLLVTLLNPFALYLLIVLGMFYIFWSIWKLSDEVHELKSKLLLPFIQISSDIAIMAGFLAGLLKR